MPLALLEYGRAGLATVATRVGQVSEVLDEGRAGQLVAPGRPAELATAMLAFLRSAELRAKMGAELLSRMKNNYSKSVILAQLTGIYQTVLGEKSV
jgi:glycosyltransferase involved in cell wall biosynthesis